MFIGEFASSSRPSEGADVFFVIARQRRLSGCDMDEVQRRSCGASKKKPFADDLLTVIREVHSSDDGGFRRRRGHWLSLRSACRHRFWSGVALAYRIRKWKFRSALA